MIRFLNRRKILDEATRLIESSRSELIVISPFLTFDSSLIQKIGLLTEKGLNILIICRWEKVNDQTRKHLSEFDLTILDHKHVHSKCLYNGHSALITSMNLYGHSEKNNREMGTIFELEEYQYVENKEKNKVQLDLCCDAEEEDFLTDIIEEINSIINSSNIVQERKSYEPMEILKSDDEYLEEYAQFLNENCRPKKFRYQEHPFYSTKYVWCEQYFDKIDLIVKTVNERFELIPKKEFRVFMGGQFTKLHQKEFDIQYNGELYKFTSYLNNESRINLVGLNYYGEGEELSSKDRFQIWKNVIQEIYESVESLIIKVL